MSDITCYVEYSATTDVDVICTTGTITKQNIINKFYCVYEDPAGTPANAPNDINIRGNFSINGCDNPAQNAYYDLTISGGSQSGYISYVASYWDNCGDPDRIDCPSETIVDYNGFQLITDTTPTPTPTQTNTPTNSMTPTITPTNTMTPTNTGTNSVTPTPTPTKTTTATNTPTNSSTPTNTPTPSITPSNSPIYEYNLLNDCGSFTIFPLGLDYTYINPDSINSTNGSIRIKPTGGTTPYSFYWVGGQRTDYIDNLSFGSYTVTVVDYNGDFSATTTINLYPPSQTPTATPTVTPSQSPNPTYPDLCLNISFPNEAISPIQFIYNTVYNNKPSWVSGAYNLRWVNNRWEIINLTYFGGKLISFTNSIIPDNGWSLVGTNETAVVSLVRGTCTSSPLSINAQVNNSKCASSSNCNGSIIVNAIGGTPPYVYSINTGVHYQSAPIFTSLCQGTYSISVLDSMGAKSNKSITVGYDDSKSNYVLSLEELSNQKFGSSTVNKTWKLNITPELPIGVTALFNLDFSSKSYIFGPGSGVTSVNSIIYKNNSILTPYNTIYGVGYTNRDNCENGVYVDNPRDVKTYSVSLTKGDILSGITTSFLKITDPETSNNGCSTKLEQEISISLSETRVTGCLCCALSYNKIPFKLDNHVVDFSNMGTQSSVIKYPLEFSVSNDSGMICSELNLLGYINSPMFGPGVTVFNASGDILYGYGYINYNGTIYVLNTTNGVVGQSTGNNC